MPIHPMPCRGIKKEDFRKEDKYKPTSEAAFVAGQRRNKKFSNCVSHEERTALMVENSARKRDMYRGTVQRRKRKPANDKGEHKGKKQKRTIG